MKLPLVVLFTVLNHLAYTGSRVTVALFALHEGASALAVGLLMSLFALLSMLISVPVGRLVDRTGVYRPVTVAAGAVFSGLLLPFAWPDLRALYPAARLIGTGFGVYFVVINNMTGALGRPEQRARNFSWLALGFSTGGFCGPLLAGFSIDSVGFRAALRGEHREGLRQPAHVVNKPFKPLVRGRSKLEALTVELNEAGRNIKFRFAVDFVVEIVRVEHLRRAQSLDAGRQRGSFGGRGRLRGGRLRTKVPRHQHSRIEGVLPEEDADRDEAEEEEKDDARTQFRLAAFAAGLPHGLG